MIEDLDFEKSYLPNSTSKCNIKRKLLLEATQHPSRERLPNRSKMFNT